MITWQLLARGIVRYGGLSYSKPERCLHILHTINQIEIPENRAESGETIIEQFTNYVKPELLIVAIVLYFIGIALKQAQAVKDKYIPLILGGLGLLICAVYLFATCTCHTKQDIAMEIFTATTQGILVAGLSTYVNQVVKQLHKED